MSSVTERIGASALSQNLTLAALGIVYDDLGTSPLYAVHICFEDPSTVSQPPVFGILSLIAWALFLVVTVKYVIVLLRADNDGEGGILALTALALRVASTRHHRWILPLGLFGAALFYGDGVLTPAISILSAVEGLKIGTPLIEPYVLPVALALLIGLFLIQRHGTGMVGSFFGPIDPHESTFYIGRQKIAPVPRSGLSWPFKRLFVRLSRVSLDATEFFHIPVERVIEFGGQVEL